MSFSKKCYGLWCLYVCLVSTCLSVCLYVCLSLVCLSATHIEMYLPSCLVHLPQHCRDKRWFASSNCPDYRYKFVTRYCYIDTEITRVSIYDVAVDKLCWYWNIEQVRQEFTLISVTVCRSVLFAGTSNYLYIIRIAILIIRFICITSSYVNFKYIIYLTTQLLFIVK